MDIFLILSIIFKLTVIISLIIWLFIIKNKIKPKELKQNISLDDEWERLEYNFLCLKHVPTFETLEEIKVPQINGMIVFCKRLRNFYYWNNEWLCISRIYKKCEDVIHEYYRIFNDMKYLERVDLLNCAIKRGES